MSQTRVQPGVPTGGQFAAQSHDEVDITLDPQPRFPPASVHPSAATYPSAQRFLEANPEQVAQGTPAVLGEQNPSSAQEVTVGVLDDAAVRGLNGTQCHAMALALHERTGWPMVSFGLKECVEDCDGAYEDSNGDCSCQADYVTVQRPDGKIVDANGAVDVYRFESFNDDDYDFRDVPDDRLEDMLTRDPTWQRPNIEVARGYVDAVLALPDRD